MKVQIRPRGPSSVRLRFTPGLPAPVTEFRVNPSTYDLEMRQVRVPAVAWEPLPGGNIGDRIGEATADAKAAALAAAADRAQVSTLKGELLTIRDQTQDVVDDAALLVAQANGTVSTIAANVDTWEQAQAVLASFAEGAGLNINADGANNGFYVKQGGIWIQKSAATAANVNARLSPIEAVLDSNYAQLDGNRPYVWTLAGPDGLMRELASVSPDGVLSWPAIVADELEADRVLSGGQSFFGYDTLEPGDIILTDSLGRITGTLSEGGSSGGDAEVVEARGSTASLSDRLEIALDPRGHLLEPTWGLYRLRQTRWKLRNLAVGGLNAGGTSYPVVFNTLHIGDSYTAGPEWVEPFTRSLRAMYGNASGGFINLRSLGLLPFAVHNEVTVTTSGTWTDVAVAAPTPDRGYAQSTTAASKITVTTTVAKAPTLMRLYYVPTADGQVRYRWNGGAWTDLALTSGTLAASVDLTGLPVAAATWTLEIEVVSGTVRLGGFYHTYAGTGARVNKCGQNGSSSVHWSAALGTTAPEWQALITGMNIDLFTIMLSANDQPSIPANTIAANLLKIAQNCKASSPAADVLIVQQPENHLGRTQAMKDITAVVRDMCVANELPFLDTQYVFGDTIAEYAQGGVRDFLPDGMHPGASKGGFLLADAYVRAITQGF